MFNARLTLAHTFGLLALASVCAGCESGGKTNGETDDAATNGIETKGPDLQCDGCYVVNAAITGNKSTIFVRGYVGDSNRAFVRRYEHGVWGTLADSDKLGMVSSLWADEDALFFGTLTGIRRVELDGFKDTSSDVGGGALWGSASDDVFALEAGVVHHFDGDEWLDQTLDLGAPKSLTGSSRTAVYALDADGNMAHFDGHAWADLEKTPPARPNDLSAIAAGGLLAVAGADTGAGSSTIGRIMRYDGKSWKVLQQAPHDALLGVASAGDDLIYAVGGSRRAGGVDPVVWRFDGAEFTRHVLPGDALLWDVFCQAKGSCYAVGTDNTFIDLGDL